MIKPNLLKYNNLIKTKKKLKYKTFNLNIEFLVFLKKYKKITQFKLENINIMKKKKKIKKKKIKKIY